MKYFDLHCDALTAEGDVSVTGQTLRRGGCGAQCFAAFIPEKEDRFARALALIERFDDLCCEHDYLPLRSARDLNAQDGRIKALLTVEGGGAVEGDLNKLEILYGRGVRLMTLTWNEPNEIGFPNFPDYAGLKSGKSPTLREKERGLTPFGREAVEKMCALGMAVDVSHGSDRLVLDVFGICKAKGIPFLASHSNAAAVQPWARNLNDEQIRLIAESGGVIGLCFCADFLSSDQTLKGQRDALLAHAEHLIKVGGEDVLALGSDFDGIPQNPYLTGPCAVPSLLKDLEKKFSARMAEKIAYQNAFNFFNSILKE